MYILKTESETIELARQIAQKILIKPGVIFLEGDLGAGKTFICKEIISYISDNTITASSPTFNIMKVYNLPALSIYHLDLYRIKVAEELLELGVQELESAVILVEWPELARDILIPDISIKLNIIDGIRSCEVIHHHTDK